MNIIQIYLIILLYDNNTISSLHVIDNNKKIKYFGTTKIKDQYKYIMSDFSLKNTVEYIPNNHLFMRLENQKLVNKILNLNWQEIRGNNISKVITILGIEEELI
jgi:hypothetical protein